MSTTHDYTGTRKEILFDGYFYDVTNFVDIHPGGHVIEYYAKNGEDSTLAIQQLHRRSIEKVRTIMSDLKRRPASSSEIGLDPKVQQKNRSFTEDFTKLCLELESEGCFKTSYTRALIRLIEVLAFTGIGLNFFSQYGILKLLGLMFILIGRIRAAFLVHEIAHFSYTGHPEFDRIMASLVDGLFVGRSGSRWRNLHYRHHAMPQRLNHDIDLETMPLLAYNAKIIKQAGDGNGFYVQNQASLYALNTLLVGLIRTLYQDPKYILKHMCHIDFVALIGHYLLYYHLGFWTWLFCLWGASFYFLLTFSLNHTFMPVTTEPIHWIEYALHHTADVEHGALYDWATGYLNYEIEHHLFPTIPHFRLASIKDRVRGLAKKHNITYHIHTYPEAVQKMFKNLTDVAEQVKHKAELPSENDDSVINTPPESRSLDELLLI